MNDEQIRSLAWRLKKMGCTANPFTLCELLNITVIETPLPSTLRGFFTTILGSKIITLSAELPPIARDATCAHEIGHALLHEGMNIFELQSVLPLHRTWEYERQADLFAACLIIPADELLPQGDYSTYADTAQRLGVPESLLRLYCEAFPTPELGFAG